MTIIIMVLVGLSIGGLWLYARRRTDARSGMGGNTRAAKSRGRPGTAAADDSTTTLDPQAGTVKRVPSLEAQLRDSLLATEVVEVGFDDQLASDLQQGELDRAIFLLKQLIQARPGDTAHRMRLLSLLHREHRRDEFIREATAAKRLTPPFDASAWRQVCQWGAELDPGNKLFTVPAVVPEASPESGQPSHTFQGIERRNGGDRRVSTSPWLGVERRKSERRRRLQPLKAKGLPTASGADTESSSPEEMQLANRVQGRYANA